jgi:SAM-dependent methyltransferase
MAETFSQRYDDAYWNALEELVGQDARDSVADFGCGPGLLLAEAIDRFRAKKVFGIDVSDEMLKYAAQHLAEKLPNDCFELKQVNLESDRIPIVQEGVTLGLSGFLLHEIKDPLDHLKQVLDILRIDGAYAIYDFVSGDEDGFVKVMKEHGWDEERARKRYPHIAKHSINDITEFLEKAGYGTVKSIRIDEARAIIVGKKRRESP